MITSKMTITSWRAAPIDKPFDKLKALSDIEGLRPVSTVERLCRIRDGRRGLA